MGKDGVCNDNIGIEESDTLQEIKEKSDFYMEKRGFSLLTLCFLLILFV